MYVFAKPLICKTFLYNATFTFTLHFFWFNFQSDLVTMLCLYSGHALAWNTCFGRHKQGWRCPNFLAPIHSITLTNVEILCSPVKNIQRFHTLKCWKAPSPLPPAPEKYLPTPLLFLWDSFFNTLSRFPPGVTILLCFSRFMTIFAPFPLLRIPNCF